FELVIFVLSVLKPSGCRFRMLKILKKFALISRFGDSHGSPNRFASVRSIWRYFGPRKELRPIPGSLTLGAELSKNCKPPPGKLLPVMKASLELLSPAPPK